MKMPRKLAEPYDNKISYFPGAKDNSFFDLQQYRVHNSYRADLFKRIEELVEYYHMLSRENFPQVFEDGGEQDCVEELLEEVAEQKDSKQFDPGIG